jgi:hypothetical protein
MAAVTRNRHGKEIQMNQPIDVHPVFAALFAHLLSRADALSARPDAPVVPDDPRAGMFRRAIARLPGRAAGTARQTGRRPARPRNLFGRKALGAR